VAGATSVAQVSVGDITTCYVTTSNALLCLGDNSSGQRGSPSLSVDATSPVAVDMWTMMRDLPGAPTGIAATGSTNSSLTLSWVAPVDTGSWQIADYILEIRPRDGDWLVVNDGISYETSATIWSLTIGVDYQIRVTAVNATGQGSASSVSDFFSVGNPPSDLSTLRITNRGSSSVTLDWDAPADSGGSTIADYIVEYRTGAGAWVIFDDGVSTSTSVTVTDLSPGSAYQFRVRAANRAPGVASPTYAGEIQQLSLSNHSCALTVSGEVQCWGPNVSGELGRGDIDNGDSLPRRVTALSGVDQISAGAYHTCALKTDRTVACWGYTAVSSTQLMPQTVPSLTDVVQVSAGYNYSCAVVASGLVKCWGSNAQGTLGMTASSTYFATPQTIPGISTATKVVTSAYHACALLADTTVKCWGSNTNRQLGNGSSVSSVTPVSVSSLTGVTDLSAGSWIYSYHTCALTNTGAVRCWGFGEHGRLGNGSALTQSIPVTAIASGATSVAVNDAFSCATTSTGVLRCWGWNGWGQLGLGSTTSQLSPVTVPGLSNVSSFATGAYHTCAVASDNELYCWGANTYGQIGSGDIGMSSYLSPERVLGLTEYPLSPPTAPTELSAVRLDSGGGLTISASYPTNNGGTEVVGFQHSLDEVNWSDPFSGPSSQINGLTNGTTYSVHVRAVTNSDVGAAAVVSLKVGSAPAAPVISSISHVAAGRALSVNFTEPLDNGEPITGYEYQLNDGAWTARADGSTTGSPLLVDGLTNGTTYAVKIRALSAFGEGSGSSAVSAVSKGIPSIPTLASAATQDRQVSISFSAPADAGGTTITNYEYSLDGASWVTRSPASSSSPISIGGLLNGVDVSIRLRAVNEFGSGPASESLVASASTVPSAPSIIEIAAPQTGGELNVAFTAPSDNGGRVVTSYEYRLNGNQWLARTDGRGSATPLRITGLANGTSYSITIRAQNSNGGGASSAASLATPRTTPGAPTITRVTSGNQLISVAFAAPANNGGSAISNYEYSLNGGLWVPRSPVSTTSPLIVGGLVNGTAVAVRIRAINAMGAGESSNTISSTPSTTSGAPLILGITAPRSGGKLNVEFSAPADNGGSSVTGYEYRLNGGSWSSRGDGRTVESPLEINGLQDRTPYVVELRAVNINGTGPASQQVSGAPAWIPDLPEVGGAQASSVGPNSAILVAPVRTGEAPGNIFFEMSKSSSFANSWFTSKIALGADSAGFQSKPVTVGDLDEDTTYFFRPIAENMSGQVLGTSSFLLTTPPIGISVENGAQFTNNANVTLNVSWAAGAIAVLLSNDGGFKTSRRFDLARTVRWTLASSGSERLPKTVYARFVLSDGSRTLSYSDDIILDEVAPTISRVKATSTTGSAAVVAASTGIANTVAAANAGRSYRLTIAASDDRSGVESLMIKGRGSATTIFSKSIVVSTKSPRLQVRVKDKAGNWSKWTTVELPKMKK
jgi:titin